MRTSVLTSALLCVLLVLPLYSATNVAEAAPTPANIDRNGVLMLVRSTLLALDQANKTGNYSVLRDLGAPRFQANTDSQLSTIFLEQRRTALDLSGVAVIEPQLSVLPEINDNGVMHLAGFFPSVPAQVNFDLVFAPINRQWRVLSISVQIGASSPPAPAAQASQPQAPVPSVRRPTETSATTRPKHTQPKATSHEAE